MASRDAEQPGDSPVAHARAVDPEATDVNVNKLDSFMRRGEEILDTFSSSIRAFEAQTLQIKSLAASVKDIKAELKRKSAETGDDSPNKVPRAEAAVDVSSDENFSDDSEDDVDVVLADPSQGTSTSAAAVFSSQDEILANVDQFCEVEGDLNVSIKEPVAKMVNNNLRRTKLDPLKVRALADKYKRPENVSCLQVPKVDTFLWGQLKNPVKTADVIKLTFIGDLNQIAGPLVKGMDHCCGNSEPDVHLLKECIGDCFKFICGAVTKLNTERREAIKKELDSKFISLCSADTPISATGLFGDNLQDQTKQLDAAKDIQMTRKVPFLGQGRGSSNRNRKFTKGNPSKQQTQTANKQKRPFQFDRSTHEWPQHSSAKSRRSGKLSDKKGSKMHRQY